MDFKGPASELYHEAAIMRSKSSRPSRLPLNSTMRQPVSLRPTSFFKISQLTLGGLWHFCSDGENAGLGRSPAARTDSPFPHVTRSIAASDSNGNKSRPNATRLSIVQGTVYPTWPPRGARSVNRPRMNLQHQSTGFFLSCVNTSVPRGQRRHWNVKSRNMYSLWVRYYLQRCNNRQCFWLSHCIATEWGRYGSHCSSHRWKAE